MGTRNTPDRERYWAERQELARYHHRALRELGVRSAAATGVQTPSPRRPPLRTFRGEAKAFGKLLWWHLLALASEAGSQLLAVAGLR
jgi:hypothetical protein